MNLKLVDPERISDCYHIPVPVHWVPTLPIIIPSWPKQKLPLPGEAKNLAWLTLDEEEGMEYWLAMNLAGDYALPVTISFMKKLQNSWGESH